MKSILTRSSTPRRWSATASAEAEPTSSSIPAASVVDDHEIREPTIPPSGADRRRSGPVITIAIVLTGVMAGVSGMLLGLLLHFVQHVAYGYSLDAVVSPESFLQGVTAAPPNRRVTALTICGAVAGIGWWAVYRFG